MSNSTSTKARKGFVNVRIVYMATEQYFYRLCEAEKIKQTYSSWINKRAHLGKGQFEILKTISVNAAQARKQAGEDALFSVKFEFWNGQKIDAWHFLKNNGLTNHPAPVKAEGSNS